MWESSTGRFAMGLAIACACTTQRTAASDTCPTAEPASDAEPHGELSRAGAARSALALQLSQGSLDVGGGLTWFAGPPDATTLYIHNLPACNENTLEGLSKYVDGPRGLRAQGFVRVSCYPETIYGFDVPAKGDAVNIEQPGAGDGWYCAIINRRLDAGLCLRDPGRCRELATTTEGAEPACEARKQAYCSSLRGEPTCFNSAEACVHLSEDGSTPCEVEY